MRGDIRFCRFLWFAAIPFGLIFSVFNAVVGAWWAMVADIVGLVLCVWAALNTAARIRERRARQRHATQGIGAGRIRHLSGGR